MSETMPRFEGVLLPEHVAVCEAQTDRWMTAGLSTEWCDRPAVEAAVRRVAEGECGWYWLHEASCPGADSVIGGHGGLRVGSVGARLLKGAVHGREGH